MISNNLCVLFGLATLVVVIDCQHQPQQPSANPAGSKMSPQKAEELRKKYKSGGFVRDMDHIKEDLKHVIKFSDDGTFTVDESIFYLMRMHDFDDNNKLDGLELLRAFGHAHVHEGDHNENEPDAPVEVIEQLVDETMLYDTDNDGQLTYAEWLTGHNAKYNHKK